MLAPELLSSARALRASGFTVVEVEPWAYVAVQSKWHWEMGTHLTLVLRVRRVGLLTAADARSGRDALRAIGDRWDPSKLPRGFQHARWLLDVIVCDQPDAEAQAFATGPTGKGAGSVLQTALVAPDGRVLVGSPVYGAMFWPKVRHAIDVVATQRPSPAPISTLGLVIGLLLIYPGLLILGLMCCGLPLIALPVLVLAEKDLPSALPP